jgi:hypothetical protein
MKTNHPITASMFAVCILAGGLMCQDRAEPAWQGRIETKGGRVVISNPKDPIFKDGFISLQEELSIGGAKESRSEAIFGNIKDIGVDDEGRIYELDLRPRSIRVFDQSGAFLKLVGRQGQGPGEFQMPWSLSFLSGGGLAVYDFLARKMLFYQADGTPEKNIPLSLFGACSEFAVNSKGHFIGKFMLPQGGAELKLIELESGATVPIAKLEKNAIPQLEQLSPTIVWALGANDQIVWGSSDTYAINICDSAGTTLKTIVKDAPPVPVNEADFADSLKTKFGGQPIPPEFEQEFPRNYPAFRKILTDASGIILVQTFEKNGDGLPYFDVFDAEGRYLSRFAMGSALQAWKNGCLYVVQEDADGFLMIKRFKVDFAWPAEGHHS